MKHRWGPRCARPVFSGERLGMVGDKLCYSLPKPTADGQTIMVLKPRELLHKLAQLIPPPRRHRHHYHGVLASNSPLRTQMATNANKRIIPENIPAVEKEELPFLIPETSHLKKEEPPLPSKEDIKIEAQEQPRKLPSKASLFRWAMPPTKKCHPWHFFPISKCTAFRKCETWAPWLGFLRSFPSLVPNVTIQCELSHSSRMAIPFEKF